MDWEVFVMETTAAVVFLAREERQSALFFQDILFDPAALWLSKALLAEGVRRFFVICPKECSAEAQACFPPNTEFVDSDAPSPGPRRHRL